MPKENTWCIYRLTQYRHMTLTRDVNGRSHSQKWETIGSRTVNYIFKKLNTDPK